MQAHPGRGPGVATPSVTFWVGANSMWSVWPANNGTELGPNRTASRAALGGITIGLSGLTAAVAGAGAGAVTFTAEQRIGRYGVTAAPCLLNVVRRCGKKRHPSVLHTYDII